MPEWMEDYATLSGEIKTLLRRRKNVFKRACVHLKTCQTKTIGIAR